MYKKQLQSQGNMTFRAKAVKVAHKTRRSRKIRNLDRVHDKENEGAIWNTKSDNHNSNISGIKPTESYQPIRYSNLGTKYQAHPLQNIPKSPALRPKNDKSISNVGSKHQKRKKVRKRSKNFLVKEKYKKGSEAAHSQYGDENRNIQNTKPPTGFYVATGGYQIRGRKKSAREIIAEVKQRLKRSDEDYTLKPNHKFRKAINSQFKSSSLSRGINKV